MLRVKIFCKAITGRELNGYSSTVVFNMLNYYLIFHCEKFLIKLLLLYRPKLVY